MTEEMNSKKQKSSKGREFLSKESAISFAAFLTTCFAGGLASAAGGRAFNSVINSLGNKGINDDSNVVPIASRRAN